MPWSGLSHRVGLHEVVGLHQVDVEVDGAAEDGGEVGHLGQVSHQLRKLRVQLGLKHCVFVFCTSNNRKSTTKYQDFLILKIFLLLLTQFHLISTRATTRSAVLYSPCPSPPV